MSIATEIHQPSKTHLSRREAASYLSLSEQTLGKWATLGRGPSFSKLPGGRSARVRYEIAELDRFLRGGEIVNTNRAA